MSEKLKYAYSLKSTKDTIQLYKIWSKTYDENFALNNNYKSPQNIVKYFNQYSNIGDFPILDVGAGTGLVGEYLKKYCSSIIHALDISNEMLNIAKQKECYEKIIVADLNKKLLISDNTYGAILSAGTFTHGHVGPNALRELLRITKPGGLFVISIHEEIFAKKGFKEELKKIGNKISQINYHRVNVYGKAKKSLIRKDKVIITKFRKGS